MQEELLEGNPDEPLQVYAIWSNQLPSDSRGGWNPGLLSDARVAEYWDGAGVTSPWVFTHRDEIGFEFFGGAAVWDSSLLFGPGASWKTAPGPIEHFGYTVIREKRDLLQNIERIWASMP